MSPKYALSAVIGLSLLSVAGPAVAACSAGDRPPAPFDVKAAPKLGSETTAIFFSWRWKFWSGGNNIFWDIEVTDGAGRIVESLAGVGRVSARNNFAVPREYRNLAPGTRRCLRVRARTEGATQGCVSASWAGPACATTALQPPGSAWAAVAADGKGRWGYAVGQPSEAVARRKALQGCGAAACKIARSAQGACVAYAESRSGGYWFGVSIVPTKWQAQSVAKDWCAKGAPKGTCKLVDSICR